MVERTIQGGEGMTREEAIEILKDDVMCQSGWVNQLCGNSKKIAKGRIKAHEMAIEALKAEPCVDAVSREAAIATADYTDCLNIPVEICKQVTDEVVKRLKSLPSVTPARKKGGWGWVVAGTFDDFFKCSCCGYMYPMQDKAYNFCPDCGAEMKGVSE